MSDVLTRPPSLLDDVRLRCFAQARAVHGLTRDAQIKTMWQEPRSTAYYFVPNTQTRSEITVSVNQLLVMYSSRHALRALVAVTRLASRGNV